ncbi:hypothetical protein ACFFQW_43320 [Umezawaea endophytica]|uniref:Transmembrane protein n=1 Tax=Umezawaea endophytica TaxID=1654476 RepID=A0A9X2VXI1_9PSEU|nr:hypothetical protein [Umezawaea endophytica]MCS7484735.1 hypothetical protein [Umezawaea endophytica]
MSTQSLSPVARLVRRVFHGRNPLTRASDRVESTVFVVAVLLALLGVPIAAAIGSEVHARESAVSADQMAGRHQVKAILLQDSAPGAANGVTGLAVRASWVAPDGTRHEGEVSAAHDLAAGAAVPVWIDGSGAVTSPPLTPDGAVITAIGLAGSLWLGLVCVLCSAYLTTVHLARRGNARRWAAEWAEVEPRWTRRIP